MDPTGDLAPYYHREGDTYLIEINLASHRQLFNSLDPSPFIEKDLDDDAEQYIVSTAGEFSLKTPLKLVIHLPANDPAGRRDDLEQALRNYFGYRHHALGRELRQKLEQGRFSFLIASLALVSCLTGYRLVEQFGGDTLAWEVLAEGLMIGGWVAMWRPIETFLYDWRPISKRRKLYDKLQSMEVEVREH